MLGVNVSEYEYEDGRWTIVTEGNAGNGTRRGTTQCGSASKYQWIS